MRYIVFFFVAVSIVACSKSVVSDISKPSQDDGLTKSMEVNGNSVHIKPNSPFLLESGENEILLADYFGDMSFDTVYSDINKKIFYDLFSQTVILKNGEDYPLLSNLILKKDSEEFALLLKKLDKKKISFRLKDAGFSEVFIKGQMNGWNADSSPLFKRQDYWLIEFDLEPGDYQYKFVVDGKEMLDPLNRHQISDDLGVTNSVYSIKFPKEKLRIKLSTESYSDTSIILSHTDTATKLFAYHNNKLLKTQKVDGLKTEIILPNVNVNSGRSYVHIFANNPYGISNDVLIPLQNGRVVQEANQLTRHDDESQIMYFSLIDRFSNGNKQNDAAIKDERLKPITNFMGGDLQGITQKIKSGYFDSLGINSIVISPITQNPTFAQQESVKPNHYYSGYHGDWPVSSSKVDARFGNSFDLKELVAVAHENDINVILDFVINHVHESHPMIKNNPEWSTQLYLGEGKQNLRLWDEYRYTTWSDVFLPSLDYSNQELINAQIDSTLYWIRNFEFDGFRYDANGQVPSPFWRQLTTRLKKDIIQGKSNPVYQIGETYGSKEHLKSYISPGLLDAQIDFNLYEDARNVFAKKESSFKGLAKSLMTSLSYYGHHSTMGNITGNYEQPRFTSLASGDVGFGEDYKIAGFDREIDVTDGTAYKQTQMLFAFVMTIPGVPIVYYGDEIGMPGAGGPDSARMMEFDTLSIEEKQTKHIAQILTTLRRERLSLIYGSTEVIDVSSVTFAFKRKYFDEETIIIFNKNHNPEIIQIPTKETGWTSVFDRKIVAEENNIQVELKPWEFDVLVRD